MCPLSPFFKMLFVSYTVNSLTIKVGVKHSAYLCCPWQDFKWSQILSSRSNQTRSYRLHVSLLNPISCFMIPIQRVNMGFFLRLPQIRVYIIWFLSGFLIGWKKHPWHSWEIMIMKMTLASHPGTKNMWFANYKSHYDRLNLYLLMGSKLRVSLSEGCP